MAPMLVGFHGLLSDVPDIFVHTLAVESSGQSQEGTALAAVQAWNAAMTAGSPASLQAQIGNNTSYTHVTAAEILNLTTGALAAATREDFPTALTGGASINVASQVSCAVSLTAGKYANGTPVKGRFYLPGVQVSTTTGKYSTSTQAVVGNALGVLVDELRNTGLVEPAVWSRKLAALQPLTAGRVGIIPDTIRSRRNGGAEEYIDVVL